MVNTPRLLFGQPRVVPAGWPPDVAPRDVVTAGHINAIKASVYQWPGHVNAGGFQLVNTGNVGIGTASPEARLTVEGGNIAVRSGNYIMFRPTANDWDMRVQAVGQRLDIVSGGASGSPIAAFVQGGNVGIGTNTPSDPLHVFRAAAVTVPLRIGNGVANAVLSVDADANITLQNTATAAMRFATGGVERMRIGSGGNVMIATTTPRAVLTVIDPADVQIAMGQDSGAVYSIGRVNSTGFLRFVGEQVSFSGYSFTVNGGTEIVRIDNNGSIAVQFMPSSNPGAGSKKLWYDPADSNRVKFAA